MRKFISLLGFLAFALNTAAATAEPLRFQCGGEFHYSDGEGAGFDGSYKWSFYLNLDEETGALVSAPMFPQPVEMDVSPNHYAARVKGEWCFKPYGPADHKSYCAVGTRTLQLDRANLSLLFSYTPDEHGKPMGALRGGRCEPIGASPGN
jgi:hypothetical protein